MSNARQTDAHDLRFSLLEILLALAILGGSLAVLGQIAETGTGCGPRSPGDVDGQNLCARQNSLKCC